MKKDDIIKKVNSKYLERKMMKFPYTAPELLSKEVKSDQIKAVVDVFAEIIEEITESRPINVIEYENNEDFEFKKKVIDLHRLLHNNKV